MKELDADQRAALRRFVSDLDDVVDGASRPILSRAYQAALASGRWELLVAILADALGDPDVAERTPKHSRQSYRRLRSVVRENADLLPLEMLHLAAAP